MALRRQSLTAGPARVSAEAVTGDDAMDVRVSMLVCAGWTLLFSIPVVLTHPDRRDPDAEPAPRVGLAASYRALGATLAGLWRTDRDTVAAMIDIAMGDHKGIQMIDTECSQGRDHGASPQVQATGDRSRGIHQHGRARPLQEQRIALPHIEHHQPRQLAAAQLAQRFHPRTWASSARMASITAL